ncbi:MAG: hypothetical protein ACI849_001733, partial [Patiriisocius sp.]
CSKCGAKVIEQRLTIGHIAEEMKQGFFNIDSSKPIRTFIDLFTKPEIVIDGYIKGTRKKFIHAFGYFTIAITLSGLFYFIAFKFFPESMDLAFNFINQNEEEIEAVSKLQKTMFEYQSALFFAFIPFFAFISWLVFLNKKKYNFAEHLVLNLYAYAQISIFTVLFYFASVWNPQIFKYVMLISLPMQIVVYAYMVKRIFALSIKQLIIKTLYFFVIGGILYTLGIIALLAIILLTGSMDLKDFIPKKETIDAVSYTASSVANWTS